MRQFFCLLVGAYYFCEKKCAKNSSSPTTATVISIFPTKVFFNALNYDIIN